MIYPTTMEEALPSKKKIADVKSRLEKAGVKYVFSCWVDLLGLPKTKPVPINEFEALCTGKGPQFAVHSVSMVPELGPSDSDQIPIPDLDAVYICPWDRTQAIVFADLFWEGKPYNVCPRLALKRQVAKSVEAGYRPMAGVEPEFVVMRFDENGRPVKAFDNDPTLPHGTKPRRQGWGYDVEASIDSMGFLGAMIDILNELGWELHDVVAEGAYSQFELDFGYTHAVEMADRFTFLRVLLKEVAKQQGLFVTYMPKPTIGDWRSGAHINFSLQDAKTGANVFGTTEEGWRKEAYNAIGGLLRHGGAIAALTCSTVNSYKGLVARVPGFEGGVYTWAPTHVTYGPNNRSAMLRLPQNRYCVENRATDMCMNAYLALATTTAVSLKGVVEKIQPGEPLGRNLYGMTEAEFDAAGVQRLPRSLGEAIEIFKKDDVIKDAIGAQMHSSYIQYKTDEWERYSVYITNWEVDEYLRFY